MASDLFERITKWNEENSDAARLALHHLVWGGTPWVCDAYTGRDSKNDKRGREMRLWCRDRFGPDAWPLHGKFGRWLFGGATVDGWTWVGFDTEAAMSEFRAAWPPPSGVPLPG